MQLENLGINMVIYPVTTQRLAMKAISDGLQSICTEGSQEQILDQMQTRKRLYEVLGYEEYGAFDEDVFNFRVE